MATTQRVNEQIRIREVRVIDENSTQLGIMPTDRAQQLARERGLDLVEVAPTARPPVCRLLDYGQYRYDQAKRARDARKRQRAAEVKEVRFGIKIGEHDFDTKIRRAGSFLADGDRVKLTVRFRGREITHPQLGRDLLDRAAAILAAQSKIDRAPTLEGKSMFLLLSPASSGGEGPPGGEGTPVSA